MPIVTDHSQLATLFGEPRLSSRHNGCSSCWSSSLEDLIEMKAAHLSTAALAVSFLLATGLSAQGFNDHDRQVVNDYAKQHQNNAPAGLRSQDQLTPEQERRLQSGQALDRQMQRQVHTPPRTLLRQLSPAPRGDRYVLIGQHMVLVDRHNNVVHDVIHVHR
jgi:Ni/Co efflux regulator RcnB